MEKMRIRQNLNIYVLLFIILCSNTVRSNELASALSSQEVENSDLRKGFQFVYSIANSFVDLFEIKYPNDLSEFNNITVTLEYFTENWKSYLTDNWKDIFNKVDFVFLQSRNNNST